MRSAGMSLRVVAVLCTFALLLWLVAPAVADSSTFIVSGTDDRGTPLTAAVTAVVNQDLDPASPTYLQATTSFLVYNISPWVTQTAGDVTVTNGSPVLSGIYFKYPITGETPVPVLQAVGTMVDPVTATVSGTATSGRYHNTVLPGDFVILQERQAPSWGKFTAVLQDEKANDRGVVRSGGTNLFVSDYVESPLAWQVYLGNVGGAFSAESLGVSADGPNFAAKFRSAGSTGTGSGTGVVPEPASAGLLLVAASVVGVLKRRRTQSA